MSEEAAAKAWARVDTLELTGPALAWAVATVKMLKGELTQPRVVRGGTYGEPDSLWFIAYGPAGVDCNVWAPHKDWSQGGPLLEGIVIAGGRWSLTDSVFMVLARGHHGELIKAEGLALLESVCRAYVAVWCGLSVNVPAELVTP
jgi:hypothetical protein